MIDDDSSLVESWVNGVKSRHKLPNRKQGKGYGALILRAFLLFPTCAVLIFALNACSRDSSVAADPNSERNPPDESGVDEKPMKVKKLPVYPVESTEADLRERLIRFEAVDDASLVAAVPRQPGVSFCHSPATEKGSQGWQLFEWTGPATPGRIRCVHSGVVFPNDDYPMEEELSYENHLGQSVVARYYTSGPGGRRHFFDEHANYLAKLAMGQAAHDYAALYRLTGDKQFARRSALILEAFAEAMPTWVPWFSHADGSRPLPELRIDLEQKHNISNISWWLIWSYTMIPQELVYAYDSLKGSEALTSVLQEKLIADVFDPSLALQQQHKFKNHNADPYTHQSLALMGRVLERPEMVDEAMERADELAKLKFFYDGFWKEGSVAYHLMATNNLRKTSELLGPEDRNSETVKSHLETLEAMDTAVRRFTYPDGRAIPVADDWHRPVRGAVRASGPEVFGGMGHARLTHPGPVQTESHLLYNGNYGHTHLDKLSITLFSHGLELLSENGYTHTILRTYATGTSAHNTVMVDGKHQVWRREQPAGALEAFGGDADGPQVVEARDPRIYEGLSDYRRRLIQIPLGDEGAAYVIDIFRVEGGRERHDYFLHGPIGVPADLDVSLDMMPTGLNLAGTEKSVFPKIARQWDLVIENGDNFESLFREVSEGKARELFSATWTARTEGGPVYLKSYFPATTESYVFSGRTPSVRPAQRDNAEVLEHWRPSLLLRRPVPEDGSANAFVAIHEVFSDQAAIRSIDLLQDPSDDRALVLRIAHTEGVDLVVSSPQVVSTSVAGVSTRGRLAVLRQDSGGGGEVFLYDTSSFAFEEVEFTAPPSAVVSVRTISDDGAALVIAPPPEGSKTLLRSGAPLRVGLGDGVIHAYTLESVEANDDGTLNLVTSPRPGFRLEANGSAQETNFPRRSLDGPVQLYIDSILRTNF